VAERRFILMDPIRLKEEEFRGLLNACAQLMNSQVQQYNLLKYGLDPEDILQEVKVRIWKLVASERAIVSPAPYIRKIVSSAVIDQLRKRRREADLFHNEQQRISERESSYCGEAARKRAFEQTVGRAVEKLIDSRRQVVKLYLLNLSIPEISDYMGWSQNKTRNLLYRGLADIRKSLKDLEAENEKRAL